jgi:hypothetical protein
VLELAPEPAQGQEPGPEQGPELEQEQALELVQGLEHLDFHRSEGIAPKSLHLLY